MSSDESNSGPTGSNRAQGHGEPPEELLSLTTDTDTLSGESVNSQSPARGAGFGGQMNGASGGGAGDSAELEPSSGQGGHSQPIGHPAWMGAPFAAVDTPQSPAYPPSSTTDEDREEGVPGPAPNMDTITGNGPVPRDRGNIGESLGMERQPPNGV